MSTLQTLVSQGFGIGTKVTSFCALFIQPGFSREDRGTSEHLCLEGVSSNSGPTVYVGGKGSPWTELGGCLGEIYFF